LDPYSFRLDSQLQLNAASTLPKAIRILFYGTDRWAGTNAVLSRGRWEVSLELLPVRTARKNWHNPQKNQLRTENQPKI
jgi:hypothetical protein